jgi:hypothetical protein
LGGILHVAGVPGFLGNLDEVMEASDSEGGSWRAFIQLWWDRFGSAEVSVSDLIGFAKDDNEADALALLLWATDAEGGRA